MAWRDTEFVNKLKCRILVVGAGGIGCELLKNLVLTGFRNIDIIDLDTIDVSNLNRQFLFRREHVGQPKAKIAAEAVRNLASNVNVIYHHDSILSYKYNIDFFQQFALVLGALDNRAARRHINRLCLAARTPLIDSGSAGYRGQVSVILRDRTECYECVPKPVQKTYPGCTIRNTPSEPVHCIVWAKHLFNQLFGEIDVDDEVSPDPNYEKAVNGEIETLSNGRATAKANFSSIKDNEENRTERSAVEVEKTSIREWASANGYEAKLLFHKFFRDDINYLLSLTDLWKERRKPSPLDWDDLPNQNPGSSRKEPNNSVWTALQCKEYFETTLATLKERASESKVLVWDKDDDVSMQFVAACANLRACVFNIPMTTLFELKSIAGNIIPAIATTNAIVAGMIVVEALKIVFGRESSIRNFALNGLGSRKTYLKIIMTQLQVHEAHLAYLGQKSYYFGFHDPSGFRILQRIYEIFIQPTPSGNFWGKLLADELPVKPNPNCYVCSERRELTVKLNTALTTVRVFESKFLKGFINMVAPDVLIAGTPNLILSSEDGLTEGVAEKMLKSVGVINGVLLDCDDFQQKFEVRIRIAHSDEMKADEFVVISDSEKSDDLLEKSVELLPQRKRSSGISEPSSSKRARICVEK